MLHLAACRSTTTRAAALPPTPASDPSASSSRGRVRFGCTPPMWPSKAKGQRYNKIHNRASSYFLYKYFHFLLFREFYISGLTIYVRFTVSVFSLQLPHHIHDLQLEHISQYVLVTQQHGFTLAWEGRSGSVYIKLSPEFVGRTCGLCGNFNADVQDDLKTSYGKEAFVRVVSCSEDVRKKKVLQLSRLHGYLHSTLSYHF